MPICARRESFDDVVLFREYALAHAGTYLEFRSSVSLI
jgi:hypothetical protein